MVESRPDWCVSRQRAWGVPITVFVHKVSAAKCCATSQVHGPHIADAVQSEGADAWYTSPGRALSLAIDFDADDYDKRHRHSRRLVRQRQHAFAFVLESGLWGLKWPADLYLEGSDQHRGWFQSSLLESLRHACAGRRSTPC